MKRILIDGIFLTERLTGVQRFAREIVKRMAETDTEVLIALPEHASFEADLPENVRVVRSGKQRGRLWEQTALPAICRQYGAPLLCTGNIAPALFGRAYVILHDLTFCEKDVYTGLSWRIKSRMLVRSFIYRASRIFTVSEFSKSRILHFYPRLKRDPVVLFCGWEHMESMEERPVEGISGQFYLTVGSVNPNKNFAYILELARHNPDKRFVVTGAPNADYEKDIRTAGLTNCTYTGYVTDEQLKWLYARCAGFILPSFYEGFGLPPLEAIACGCRNVYLSDIPPLREIYGDVARFFDPRNLGCTALLDDAHRADEAAVKSLLEKYSWKHTTETILQTIFGGDSGTVPPKGREYE